jgi:hypothetical protein
MRSGDLATEITAKIICFDPQARSFSVVRNGNPPRPEEHVPDSDIGALLRSFVRDNSSTEPAFITITDTRRLDGVETVRHVIPSKQVELFCKHRSGVKREEEKTVVSSFTALCVLAAVLLSSFVYLRFFRTNEPPSSLPDTRPYMIERRRGHRSVREALDRLR